MSSAVFLLARRRRARWHAPVALALVLATVLGGMVDVISPASAATSSITGSVFHDADRDGVRDGDEEAMPSATLTLKDATGRSIAATGTGVDGSYQFAGLASGVYTVEYSSSSWWGLWEDWVPTTTGSVRPSLAVDATGAVTADIGWRRIVQSTDSSQPLSELVGPSGVTVESFNDAVTAQEVHAALASGSLLGAEAPRTVIRFGLGGGNFCGTSGSEGSTAFSATCTVDYLGWLQHGDASMFHEYGHAWSRYHAYAVQADAGFSGYLEVRGLLGDSRLDTSHAWARGELIAEDYRQLFGSASAASQPQENQDIPPASDVDGLRDYLRTTFMHGEAEPNGSGEDVPPVVDQLTPGSDDVVAGETELTVHVTDDVTPDDSLAVSFTLAGHVVGATHDAASGSWRATFDSSILADGVHLLRAEATDAAGNVGDAAHDVVVDNVSDAAPAPPTGFSATDLEDGTARLAWQDVAGETEYRLTREQLHHRNGRVVSVVTMVLQSDTVTLVDASGEGSFRYTLIASNDVGASDPTSTSVTVTATGADGGGSGKCHPKRGC